ncbi:MAG: site-2 protease family protein [Candidatus Moranbacteria bacterium]|nr:site-2 protease family protein [Candidatus Moranbacteria bacterium]
MDIEQIIILSFYVLTLIFSIILHEISHGIMAMWLGDHTARLAGRLTLDPTKHIDPIGSIILPIIMVYTTGFAFGWAKPVPYNPYALRGGKWGEVLVAFAGPFTNFFIALVAAVIGLFMPLAEESKFTIMRELMSRDWEGLSEILAGSPASIIFCIVGMLIFWNVILGVFNLIPIPPLDGSKLLFAFVDVSLQTRVFLERWGILIILFVLGIPFFSIIFSKVLGIFWNLFFRIAIISIF